LPHKKSAFPKNGYLFEAYPESVLTPCKAPPKSATIAVAIELYIIFKLNKEETMEQKEEIAQKF